MSDGFVYPQPPVSLAPPDADYGDVTVSGGVWTIDNNAVTLAKLQDITTDRLLGRDTAGTGDPELIALDTTLEWSGAGTIRRAALTGDVTAPAGSNATTIANNAVTLAKMQTIADSTVLGNISGIGAIPDPLDIATELAPLVLAQSNLDVTWYSNFNGRVFSAYAGTLAAADVSVTGATSTDSHFIGFAMLNGFESWVAFAFPVPAELDIAYDISAQVMYSLLGAPAAGNQVELRIRGATLSENEVWSSPATTFDVTEFRAVDGAGAAGMIWHDMGVVIPGSTLGGNEGMIHGTLSRASASANDTYADHIGAAFIRWVGKRKSVP